MLLCSPHGIHRPCDPHSWPCCCAAQASMPGVLCPAQTLFISVYRWSRHVARSPGMLSLLHSGWRAPPEKALSTPRGLAEQCSGTERLVPCLARPGWGEVLAPIRIDPTGLRKAKALPQARHIKPRSRQHRQSPSHQAACSSLKSLGLFNNLCNYIDNSSNLDY